VKAIVVGAGWSGCAAAWRLTQAGVEVEVLEAAAVIGGHSRMEELCGIAFEAEGPHVFHTDDQQVIDWLAKLGSGRTWREYRICPMSEIDLGGGDTRLMSWPIQVPELQTLPCWPQIRRELEALPREPYGENLEAWCISLMGETLYRLFIADYTRKQWAREPSELSASIAPRRIDLRRDGYRPLHRNAFQAFPVKGPTGVMDRALARSTVTCGAHVAAGALAGTDCDGYVITAALDEFLADTMHVSPLPWRGIRLRNTFYPSDGPGTITPAHVVKRPSPNVPYTRTIETKHATRQRAPGTIVSYEYPGAAARHYPVPTLDRAGAIANDELRDLVREVLNRPTAFAGRLATYRYIDMDEAIRSGWRAAEELLDLTARSRAPAAAL
jgi:UDP-galactopyranose mutase